MSVTPMRAAVDAAHQTNDDDGSYTGKATVHYGDKRVSVVFTDGVSLLAEELIRDHGFKIAPHSAREKSVTLYKNIYR